MFNIGNVMLMRAQEIQTHHLGLSQISEFDDLENEFVFNADGQLNYSINANKRGTSPANRQGMSMLTSDLSTAIPELSLTKCQNYDIAKDSFTEIVLLTVISYFCVSTEQRFINMNNEKERN